MNRKTYLSFGVSLFATLAASPMAFAQAAAEGSDEIVVTGTAIRGIAPVGSAVVTLGRQQMLETGIRDPGALTTILPQGTNANSLQNSAGRGSGINLRGLGTDATLILFDGHRPITGGTQTVIADPNVIPFGAIERTEVITDGASAVYGSDAVAGVVNYIFRRPFDGGEVTARYTHTLYEQAGVDGVFGKTWSSGGLLVAGTFEANTNVTAGAVPWLRRDIRAFGGNDNRVTGTGTTVTSPASVVIVASGTTAQGGGLYGVPSNLNGRTPLASELERIPFGRSDLYDKYLVDQSDLQDFYTERQRGSAMLRLTQSIGPGELSVTALANVRRNRARGAGDGSFQQIAVNLPRASTAVINANTLVAYPAPGYTSPYYIAGLNSNLAQQAVYNFRRNDPSHLLERQDFENTGNIFADYTMPLIADYQLTLSGGYGFTDGCPTCQPQFNTQLSSTEAADIFDNVFNPYINGPQPADQQIYGIFLQNGHQSIESAKAKIDGAMFNLPGGAVRIALGGEYQRNKFHQTSIASLNVFGVGSASTPGAAGLTLPTTTYEVFRSNNNQRTVKSAFGELYVPIFGDNNAFPLFQTLDLSLALRYDKYSDFGATTNPKVGFTWVPFQDLKLRGSWGKAFRAPYLSDTAFNTGGAANRTAYTNTLGLVPNYSGNQTLVLVSSFKFKQLTAEKAEVMSFGGDYTPSFIPGFKFGASYYSVNYKDRIAGVPAAVNTIFQNQANYNIYSSFFIPAPQPAGCTNGTAGINPGSPQYATYNPIYLKYLNAAGSYPPRPAGTDDCNLVGIIDSATQNLGRVVQKGIDYTASYNTELPFATLNLNAAFTKILEYKRATLPTLPLVSVLGIIGEQIAQRGRASASLSRGPLSGSLAVNYTGSYLNTSPITLVTAAGLAAAPLPVSRVPIWLTYDMNVSFRPEGDNGWMSGSRISLNVRNLTDKDPPIVLSGTNAVDTNAHNVFGRIISVELAKSF